MKTGQNWVPFLGAIFNRPKMGENGRQNQASDFVHFWAGKSLALLGLSLSHPISAPKMGEHQVTGKLTLNALKATVNIGMAQKQPNINHRTPVNLSQHIKHAKRPKISAKQNPSPDTALIPYHLHPQPYK